MDNNTQTPLAHQINSACYRLGIGRSKLYELIQSGEIKPFKVGRRTLILEAELQRFITKAAA